MAGVEPEPKPKVRGKFSNDSLAEATALISRIPETIAQRPAVEGITIDSATSRDLDDAIWLERLPQGYVMHVSITDVQSLVRPGTSIDKDAFGRSFTRYYPNHTSPMVPAQLSEGALSLLEGQSRPAITISIPLDIQFRPGEATIRQTQLTSRKRFNYVEVDQEIDQPTTEYGSILAEAYHVAQGLLNIRRARGALAIYDIASGIATTEEGEIVGLTDQQRHKAQVVVQEFMILANQAVANFLATRNVSALFRTQAIRQVDQDRDYYVGLIEASLANPSAVNPDTVENVLIAALGRAQYSSHVGYHFGLNINAYTHFTSPLRRYPDLVNQRILVALLNGEVSPYTSAELETVARHINQIEETEMRGEKKRYFIAEHERRVRRLVTSASETTHTLRPLEGLDTKQFHSVIRLAAESHDLPKVVEQEILHRLDEGILNASDLFTLIFRFQNSTDAWNTIKRASIQYIQRNPEHAITMLLIGLQKKGWGETIFDEAEEGEPINKIFRARVATVEIDGQEYNTSAWQLARRKDLARQFAAAEMLTKIAGFADMLPMLPRQISKAEATVRRSKSQPGITTQTESTQAERTPKSELKELADDQGWGTPNYRLISKTGTEHEPTFLVEAIVRVGEQEYKTTGEGNTRKGAEHAAAEHLVEQVHAQGLVTERKAIPQVSYLAVLNEMQQKGEVNIVGHTIEQSPGAQTFTCRYDIDALDGQEHIIIIAEGRSRKAAAQQAAQQVLGALLLRRQGKS